MSDYWILDGKELKPATVLEWGAWFEKIENRRVAWTELPGGVIVSTVCLGLDHSFGEGPPIVFETMVNTDYGWDQQIRYSTWAQAEIGHMEAVEELERHLAQATP